MCVRWVEYQYFLVSPGFIVLIDNFTTYNRVHLGHCRRYVRIVLRFWIVKF